MSRPYNIKTNPGEWRNRSNSPNTAKRAVSPNPDSISDAGSTRQAGKYTRRPLSNSSTGAGQSVAALQQQHKWLMQQQENDPRKLRSTSPGHRSVSPAPSKSRNMTEMKPKQQPTTEDEVIFDDDVIEGEDEGEDIEEERMVIVQDTRTRSPSITSRGKIRKKAFLFCLTGIFFYRWIHHVSSTATLILSCCSSFRLTRVQGSAFCFTSLFVMLIFCLNRS